VTAETFESQKAFAQTMVAAMAGGDFATVETHFTPEMQASFPESDLRASWTRLVDQLGPYQSIVTVTAARQQPYVLVLTLLQYASGRAGLQFTLDSQGRIAGMWVRAPDFVLPGASAAASPTSPAASYVRPGTFHETEVVVGEAPWQLPGTLTMPNGSGPFPAAVLVAGSGPNDRDETAGPNKPFQDLAWGLASQGIATLRYDKRTLVHATSMDPNSITTKEEVMDDALAAIGLLRSTPGVDPNAVFLLGHSLGGYLAPRIGVESKGLRGIVVLEGPTRPLEKLILEQSDYLASLNGSLSPAASAQLEALRSQVARVESPDLSPSTPASELPLGIPASYWLDLRGYDAAATAATAATLPLPIFFSQGGRDYQVTMADYAGWKAALGSRADVAWHLYPSLNHLLMTGSGPSSPLEYQVPGHVASELVADLAAWLLANSR